MEQVKLVNWEEHGIIQTPTGTDYYFNIFLGGVNGSITGNSGSEWNQLHVGQFLGQLKPIR